MSGQHLFSGNEAFPSGASVKLRDNQNQQVQGSAQGRQRVWVRERLSYTAWTVISMIY